MIAAVYEYSAYSDLEEAIFMLLIMVLPHNKTKAEWLKVCDSQSSVQRPSGFQTSSTWLDGFETKSEAQTRQIQVTTYMFSKRTLIATD